MADMKLGGGGRFEKLKGELESKGNSPESAQKEAAAIGRAKYGNSKMNALAHRAKLKASKHMGHHSGY